MRIAILSDIHGNLEALTTIIEKIEADKIDRIYCLGDVVGYGPNPNECVEIISQKCAQVVIGNHDHAVLGLTSTEYFNDFAKISTFWTIFSTCPATGISLGYLTTRGTLIRLSYRLHI